VEGDSDPFLTPLRAEDDSGGRELGPGSRLGKYELIKRLSVGGMAEIFLARAVGLPGFQKLVAVKRILPQLAAKPDFLEMFLDEARIAATLQHSNIVQTYDVCVLAGNYIIAMEYLHGEDVRSILSKSVHAQRRVPLEHVLQIMIALCGGLHYAHEKEGFDGKPLNIVHRDVSPGNLIVTYDGDIKLLDFGIASAAIKARETNTGSVKGKISYMSPEQARGQDVDRRTDVFAAGVILYELSLGRKLYRGTDYEILTNIVKGKFDTPRTVDPNYDPQLEKIVLNALSRDRDQRYPTAQDLQNDLEKLARERGLFLSKSGLKKFMGELFEKEIAAWRESQKQGKSLVEHLELTASYEDDAEPLPEPAAPPATKRNLMIGGAAAGALLLVLIGVLALRPGKKAPPPPVRPVAVAPLHGSELPAPSAPTPSAPVVVKPGIGAVKIVTHPHGASLVLDGKPLAGRSPIDVDQLSAGEHTVNARVPGLGETSKKFIVLAGSHSTVMVLLEKSRGPSPAPAPVAKAPAPVAKPVVAARPVEPPPAPAPAPKLEGNGTLAIASNPWCTVAIDGVDKGQTPLSLTLPAGKHAVTLTNPDYKIKRALTVTILPNETVRKKLDFTE
jgi:serine/threonine protein kinase